MGSKYTQKGDVLTYVNGGSDISVNDVVVMADTVGIALVDIPGGGEGSVAISGVFEVPKVAGTAWGQGAVVDWDASASAFGIGITPAAGDVSGCGIAAAAAASADTVGYVVLTPGTGTAGS